MRVVTFAISKGVSSRPSDREGQESGWGQAGSLSLLGCGVV